MERSFLFATGLVAALLVTSCGDVAPKSDFPTGDPMIAFHHQDKSVTPETAKKVLDQVLAAAPQLKTLRERDEKASGCKVWLNVVLQSGPEPEAANAIERTNHFVYVNTSGEKGLVTTDTFVVSEDLETVQVFDASGDEAESVAAWAARRGLK
jgi:hypothetical protein